MENKAIHYDTVKENNKRVIRNLVRKCEVCTKRELEEYSGLSFPTVGSALKELVETGEILTRQGDSKGGRPGAVFLLNAEYISVLRMIIQEYELSIQVLDYCGKVIANFRKTITEEVNQQQLVEIVKEVKNEYKNITIAVMGIPGVACRGVIEHIPYLPQLEKTNIVTPFMEKLRICLFLENDINMIAMGELSLQSDFAHILWEDGCIGSAIVLDGRLLRGSHGAAGEVELFCTNQEDRNHCLLQAVFGITAVVDVPLIAISGKEITSQDIEELKEKINEKLANYKRPEIVLVAEHETLYEKGLWQVALEYCRQMK